jgi:broad specificity phosphatase PhoE
MSMRLNFLLRTFRITSIIALVFFLVLASSLNLYANKDTLAPIISRAIPGSYVGEDTGEKNIFWAQEILKGGYILHFRHAERDKWLDVHMYDLLESKFHDKGEDGTAFAESQYYKAAVCLNDRGLVQARAMGQVIKKVNLPISLVITSPSCRARQTADLAFGGYGKMDLLLLHEGVFSENLENYHQKLENLYRDIEVSPDKNVVISSHNSVFNSAMILNGSDYPDGYFEVEEGGFYVISTSSDGLKLEHKFKNFLDFSRALFTR